MSRTDQYIGLTSAASNYLGSIGAERTKTYEIEGAWNTITLSVYEKKLEDGVNLFERFTEEVQESPWSSGPMYFTHLKRELIKVADQEPIDMGYIYSWVVAPELRETNTQVDQVRGWYYV